ncbi:aspartate--tRNA ligase [Candidatus Parcubacteria bacterium]|nr:aspartate--tRNA ligase [Patescibacteria group bacterium]MBU4476890.1 aspartate--tRNA ligase [Patescibacteria group bacterium]MCG2699089.1 aspartate--tRNA ligase [Candidatus Parcubacteria bacterium]
MKRILIKDIANKIGESVKLAGWVDVRRDHGKLIFIDLRDSTGKVQTVITPGNKETHEIANGLRPEWVIEMEGEVKKRPENMINPELPLGGIEISANKISVLNKSKTPVFEIGTNGYEINEEIRLKYRYLDLRRERMQKNLMVRHNIVKYFRDYLSERDFIEIETPLLTKSTPEGARDFVVPSRLHQGKFYALPQSPQQYKQLLMIAGVEKYFQVAKAIRDEDTRGDRQPEHTQLDLEMSFADQETIINLIEDLITSLVKTLFPRKKITRLPWPRLTYKEAMEKYKNDKPDLRNDKKNIDELAFGWVIDFPLFEYDEKEKRIAPMHHMFTSPKDEDIGLLGKNPLKITGKLYDMVCNGHELGSGSIRINDPELQKKVFEIIGISEQETLDKFGHLLEAYEYGAPPHGGIALGIDRLVAILQGEPNIREVIAFPKTGDGRDLMMNAPSEIAKEQLDELGIEIKKGKKKP